MAFGFDDLPLLSVYNLSKAYSVVPALCEVSFQLRPGEVLGVVGMRGSGKTTLFRLLGGAEAPSSGEMIFDGRKVYLHTPGQARKLGIEAVHQNPPLAENLDGLRNIFLGRELCVIPQLRVWPKDELMAQMGKQLLESFDMPAELLGVYPKDLSNEQRQVLAISKALCRPNRLLLLDDALASLSYARQLKLLDRIKTLSAEGVSVVISSDDLKHIFAVTDRILVLFQGRQAALRLTRETTPREVVELVVGTNRKEQITPVIWAFENYHLAQQQAEELRRSQLVLRQSLEAQDSLNRQLIERLRDQVQALDRLNLALQEANRRLMTEREAERKALARDLHDQVIQDLLSYTYQLEEAESEVASELQGGELAGIRNGIREVVSSLRQMCSDLRPPTIDSHGLPAAIRSLAHQWSKQTGIEIDLDIAEELGRMPETIELSVFRIVQEGLSNVRKHAKATHVKLSMQRGQNANLLMQLVDNGRGMRQPVNLATLSDQKHFGLLGISERVSLLGGTMQVSSRSARGLELKIEIPSPYPEIVN